MLFVLAVLALVALVSAQTAGLRMRTLQMGIRRLGLTTTAKTNALGPGRVSGWVEGFPVKVETGPFWRGDTRVEVAARIPADLAVYSRFHPHRLRDERTAIPTGDTAFDDWFAALGREVDVVALLDHDTRGLLFRLRHSILIRHERVIYRTSRPFRSPNDLDETARLLVGIARLMSTGARTRLERLGEVAAHDGMPPVRLRALRLLIDRFSIHAETLAVARRGLSDTSIAVRLESALHLEEEGLARLCEIASDPSVSVEMRRRAIVGLAPLACAEARALEVLSSVYREPGRIRRAVIEAYGIMRNEDAIPELLESLVGTSAATRIATARALAEIGSSAAADGVAELLHAEEAAVRLAGVRALAAIGTASQIGVLRGLSKGILNDPELKRAAKLAVEQIQKGLGDVDSGRLSLADDRGDGGGLSLPEGDAAGLVLLEPAEPSETEPQC